MFSTQTKEILTQPLLVVLQPSASRQWKYFTRQSLVKRRKKA
jgi:hypothetical protein